MNQIEPNPLIFNGIFDDLDYFLHKLQLDDVTIDQLSSGNLKLAANYIWLKNIKLYYCCHNQMLKLTGKKNENELIFSQVINSSENYVITHGSIAKENYLFGYDPRRENDLIISKNTQIVSVVITKSFLQSLLGQNFYDELDKNFFQSNLVYLNSDLNFTIKNYYQLIAYLLDTQPLLLSKPESETFITEDLIPLLMESIRLPENKKMLRVKSFRRYHIIKKIEEFANSLPDQAITIKQLCDVAKCSSSALAYAFEDVFGITPINYIKIKRLNGIHRTLKQADPKTTTVMEIANRWGFFSLGHFSRDYKSIFGELPSQTLNKKRLC